jgi:hypothetical protein
MLSVTCIMSRATSNDSPFSAFACQRSPATPCLLHDRAKRLQVAMVERGLRDAPLLAPEVALRRQQSLSEEQTQAVEAARALAVVRLVLEQHALDALGVGHDVRLPRGPRSIRDTSPMREAATSVASGSRRMRAR